MSCDAFSVADVLACSALAGAFLVAFWIWMDV
jgi:hypothetical protein